MIVGILLAAGHGRRLGGPKALARLDGRLFHEIAIESFQAAGLRVVSVVNAGVAEALPPVEDGREVRIVNPNPDDAAGMFGSIRLGLRAAVELGASSILVLPVDHPQVTPADLRSVIEGLERAEIALPVFEGRRGHPVGLRGRALAEALSDPSVSSLRDVVRRDPSRVVEVPGSPGVREGVNEPSDLARIAGLAPVK